MKNVFFGILAFVLLSGVSYAQTFKTKGNGTVIETTKEASETNVILTKVTITNATTNASLPSFYYKLSSDAKTNLTDDLKKDPKLFSGTLTLEVDGVLVIKKTIQKGIIQEALTYDFVPTSALGKKYPCTIKGQIKCVDDRIRDMNWIDYGMCMVTAPECYGMLHASCAWDNCK